MVRAIRDTAARQDDLLFIRCTEGPAEELLRGRELTECTKISAIMATDWSKDSVNVPNSFEQAFRDFAITGLIPTTPLYDRLRNGIYQNMANPYTWAVGANMLINLFTRHPELFNPRSLNLIDPVMADGKRIQDFYRGLFSKESTSERTYRVDLSFLLTLVDNYISSAKTYISSFSEAARAGEIPVQGPNQRLPEEVIVPEDSPSEQERRLDAVLAKNSDPNAVVDSELLPVNRVDDVNSMRGSTRGVQAGHGIFLDGPSRLRYSFLSDKLNFCNGVKPQWTSIAPMHIPGEDLEKERARGRFYVNAWRPDIELLSGQGVPLDVSILPLIPREALWLERMDPSRFQVKVCLSSFNALWSGTKEKFTVRNGTNNLLVQSRQIAFAGWEYETSLQMGIKIFLFDTQLSRGIEISGAHAGLRVNTFSSRSKNAEIALFPVLTKAWNKSYVRYGTPLGPFAGNLDRFFRYVPLSTALQPNLAYLKNLAGKYREDAMQKFIKSISVGTVAAAFARAELDSKILFSVELLNTDSVPEVDVIFHNLHQLVKFRTPDILAKQLNDGVSPDELIGGLERQGFAVHHLAAQISDRVFMRPPSSPADNTLFLLEATRRNIPHSDDAFLVNSPR